MATTLGNVVEAARRVAADVGESLGIELDADTLLTGRAAMLHLAPPGRVSVGGATRLLGTADGWCAIALPREDDIAALPALLQVDAVTGEPWQALTRWAARHPTQAIVSRAQLLDIAAAELGECDAATPVVRASGDKTGPRRVPGLLVADLSSLWAGPLCGRLLARAGAVVVKVESPRRPDGTRSGEPAFFDWMNSGKLCYALDFDADRDALHRLLAVADIVIEASRPAALRRRQLSADDVTPRSGRIWLRVNGYRGQPERAAFGDDAAVAGGLVDAAEDGPVFCGDALADPLSGLEAARAVAESLRRGGGEQIDVSMAQVAARYAAESPATAAVIQQSVAPPTAAPASPLGADNAVVERIVAERGSAAC